MAHNSLTQKGVNSYQQLLSESVSGNIDLFHTIKFSASEDYKSVYKQTFSQNSVSTSTHVTCCVYFAEIETYSPPLFTTDFINGVQQLPTSFNTSTQDAFWKFINSFGTDYSQEMSMGGRYGQQSQMSREQYTTFTSSNLDISVSASYSGWFSSAAVNAMATQQKQEANDFITQTMSQSEFFVGGSLNLPVNYSVSEWVPTCQKDPMPLTYQLDSITNLLTSQYFPTDKSINSKQNALQMALNSYCQRLVNTSEILSCEGYGPDKPLPDQSIFGGLYQFVDHNPPNMNYVNPYTQNVNCMTNFDSIAIGYGYYGGGYGAVIYLCLFHNGSTTTMTDPARFFGGMYSVKSCNGQVTAQYNNPFTNNITCPSGYSTAGVANYYLTSDKCDGYIKWCYNATQSLTNGIMGGFYYDTGDAYSGDFTNQWTHAMSCPSTYKSYQIGEFNSVHQKPGKFYVCLSNVYE